MDLVDRVWLVMPSANPAYCRRTLPKWRAMGYRVLILQDRVRFESEADMIVRVHEYRGWPWAINTLCQEHLPADAEVVVAAGDDMLPDPVQDAQVIAGKYLERFPDGFGVMQPTGDDYLNSRSFCGSPWFGRGWIERAFGGLGPIPSWYRHNWADMELFWVARGIDRLWLRDDLTQRHEHFSRSGDAAPPSYWTGSVGRYDLADAMAFSQRAWSGFPGSGPIGGPEYDHNVFCNEYRSIAEVHLHARTGRVAFDAQRRMREALQLCQQRGWERVGVYGNGAHTDAIWGVMKGAALMPTVILDDAADGVAGRGEVPVRAPESASEFKLDAIVLSANSIEEALVGRAACFGLPIVRLYGERSPRVIDPVSSDTTPSVLEGAA